MARKKPESELVRALQTSSGESYRQCEWLSDGVRCRFPGSMSTNTHEGGPWFCGLHFGCDSSAYGATVVEASKDYRHHTQDEILDELTRQARENLKAKGLDRKQGEDLRAWVRRTSLAVGKLKHKKFEDAA